MNVKKWLLPLVALCAGQFAFAQIDGYEPDFNNPDETGVVFVCMEEVATSDGYDCVKGVWFTVNQIPDGNDGFKADPAQVAVLTKLYAEYPELYKVASYIKKGEHRMASYKEVLMYAIAPDAKLSAEETGDFKFQKVDTQYGSFLAIMSTVPYGVKSLVWVEEENGRVNVTCDYETVTVIK